MTNTRMITCVLVAGFGLALGVLNASPACAQCDPSTPGAMRSGRVSLLSDVPTCGSQAEANPLSNPVIGSLPAGLFLRNPLVGAATWMVSRSRSTRRTDGALTRRQDLVETLRGGRKPRQVAW